MLKILLIKWKGLFMKLNIKRDETGQKYVEVDVNGYDLINNPILNKGRSFTAEERSAFRLRGIVPPGYLPLEEIVDKNYQIILDSPNDHTIPYFDLKVAAGAFSEQQKVDNIKYIQFDSDMAINENYFACKVIGESMNKIIPNNSICLFEKYTAG